MWLNFLLYFLKRKYLNKNELYKFKKKKTIYKRRLNFIECNDSQLKRQ